jgi:dGTPase
MAMDWKKLLSSSRYSDEKKFDDDIRSPFQKDIDRIIFSSHFRRLGRKTQVHPLNENDHIHTRLSHSLETSSVGRSLGQYVGRFLIKSRPNEIPESMTEEHFGQIVQAACLAHDIGNPPFGHAGESAIKEWFKSKQKQLKESPHQIFLEHTTQNLPYTVSKEAKDKIINDLLLSQAKQCGATALFLEDLADDFLKFDGNAMAFRIMTKTGFDSGSKGMKPTFATLGAMLKYPYLSRSTQKDKFSCFYSERDALICVADEVGLIKKTGEFNYARHPLAFLVEASDDICYRVMDIEDAIELNLIDTNIFKEYARKSEWLQSEISKITDLNRRSKIGRLRAKIIHRCVNETIETFKENYELIINGELNKSLLELGKFGSISHLFYSEYENISNQIFFSRRKVEIEIGSHATIGRILNCFLSVVNDICSDKISFNEKQIASFLGNDKIKELKNNKEECHYNAFMLALDYITGMTDQYAVNLSKKFAGLGGF